MKQYSFALLALLTLLISACATTSGVDFKDIKIQFGSDPKAKFSGYKTYAWLGAAEIINDPNGQWEPDDFDADAEIKFLIDRELRARKMTEVSEKPDMVVAFTLGINMEALQLKQDPDLKMEILENVPEGDLMCC